MVVMYFASHITGGNSGCFLSCVSQYCLCNCWCFVPVTVLEYMQQLVFMPVVVLECSSFVFLSCNASHTTGVYVTVVFSPVGVLECNHS